MILLIKFNHIMNRTLKDQTLEKCVKVDEQIVGELDVHEVDEQ